ncbi:MAG: type II secretion system F family protein, partial [Lentisphaerae bacterium]|nr:type II secretion system F family protein [Lentisphaerota bacterium]
MPRFHYTAMDGRGKEQKGRLDAESEQEAAGKLKQMGLFPTSISEVKGRGGGKAQQAAGPAKQGGGGFKLGGMTLGAPVIRRKDLTTVTRQLATLLDAGLPLVRCLRTLERQARGNPALARVMGDLGNAVEGGSTFSEALAGHPKSFNKLYVNMIRAGEASGAMETVLNRLAEFMEKAARIAGKVKAAMIYPVIVLSVALSITAGLMIFIVPKFAKMFDEMLAGEPLPGLTVIVIGISNFM